MKSNVVLNVVGYLDRRTEDLHARYASIEEQRFAFIVARNHKEKDRILREKLEDEVPSLLKRQAN